MRTDIIIHRNFAQGEDLWKNIRRGRITASKLDLLFTASGSTSKSKLECLEQIALSAIIDDPLEHQSNVFTRWGHKHEDEARKAFSLNTGLYVEEISFVEVIGKPFGVSPDGFVYTSDDPFGLTKGTLIAGFETKCPKLKTHYKYHEGNKLPDEYKQQVHGSMYATGLESWYFMSYYPKTKPFIIRVFRDDYTEKLGKYIDVCCELLEEIKIKVANLILE